MFHCSPLRIDVSGELVLQGGYNPLTKQTYGGSSGGGTWLLTRHPIDHAKIAMERAAPIAKAFPVVRIT